MHWSAILVMALTAHMDGTTEVAHTASGDVFSSYNQAWKAAQETERPMLVIINPADGDKKVSETQLQDEKVTAEMNDYVVAVIDAGTEHGKKVHELFGSASLPRVVVIDKEQKKQIYRSSGPVTSNYLAGILKDYKNGKPASTTVTRPVSHSAPALQNYYQQPVPGCATCNQQRAFTF